MIPQLRERIANASISDIQNAIQKTSFILSNERLKGSIVGGRVIGSFIELEIPQNLVIVSDLHGDLESLFQIITSINYKKFLEDPSNKIIFMGDYIDRGSNSIGVLYAISILKNEYPDSIILMRGNHESPVEFPFSSHDLPFDISGHFEYEKGKRVYNVVLDLFKQLSLVTLVKSRLLIVHGGLPTELDRFSDKTNYKNLLSQAQENHMKNRMMEEILWNDPRDFIPNDRDWEESRRGYGRHFGINITKKWLEISDARAVVRGHEPCQGFRINHNGTVLTLFSCHEAYPSFQAAYIRISYDSLLKLQSAHDLVEHISML